jgi:hypothetical protein
MHLFVKESFATVLLEIENTLVTEYHNELVRHERNIAHV